MTAATRAACCARCATRGSGRSSAATMGRRGWNRPCGTSEPPRALTSPSSTRLVLNPRVPLAGLTVAHRRQRERLGRSRRGARLPARLLRAVPERGDRHSGRARYRPDLLADRQERGRATGETAVSSIFDEGYAEERREA